ncbi:hypothetical protein [Tetragenococcus halophilus]|uniref:hypothetical protein n=1 Tax=Tetragenococcus halophilus TaxID=51669 RepID=UPI00209ACA26|nr:hypothetical protein [Tetragenococcus halophilus]MCO8291293.1 hypothetical protein [Tetragenococcus halophilus]
MQMTTLSKFETDMYNSQHTTLQKVADALKHRNVRTDKAVLDDLERIVSNQRAVESSLLDQFSSNGMTRVEEYFFDNNIEIRDRKYTGTSNFYETNEGKFVENHDGNLYKVVKGEPKLVWKEKD